MNRYRTLFVVGTVALFVYAITMQSPGAVGNWQLRVNEEEAISHWMPLPSAPTIKGAK